MGSREILLVRRSSFPPPADPAATYFQRAKIVRMAARYVALHRFLQHLLITSIAGLWATAGRAQPGASLYTIPVVFHVLHENGTENISDAQIESAITALNVHFDAPTFAVDPPFDTVAGDMDLSFALATTAPDGNPATGIDRILTPLTNEGGSEASYLNPWPRNRYLNIWVVRSITTWGVFYLTRHPADADADPCTDGIVIYHSYVGSLGTASSFMTQILAQAVGRFLNLKMLSEDPIDGGPCGDDDVADTPHCVPPTCLPGPNPCDSLPANERNIMYSPYATNMFTEGQRARVHACLTSPVAQRAELASGNWTTVPQCSFTGLATHAPETPVRIFPNPFSQQLTLSGSAQVAYEVMLLDMSGRLLLNLASARAGDPIPLPEALAAGSYLLVVSDETNRIELLLVKE